MATWPRHGGPAQHVYVDEALAFPFRFFHINLTHYTRPSLVTGEHREPRANPPPSPWVGYNNIVYDQHCKLGAESNAARLQAVHVMYSLRVALYMYNTTYMP